MCEPVCRVSDRWRGRFLADTASNNLKRRGSQKPTDVGDAIQRVNHDKIIASKGSIEIATIPHSGEGGGDRLSLNLGVLIRDKMLAEKGSQMVN